MCCVLQVGQQTRGVWEGDRGTRCGQKDGGQFIEIVETFNGRVNFKRKTL